MSTLVVALNPSIDAEWRLARVRWEEKNEVLSERRWPGGKGVNVARWLRHLGQAARLLLPLGGATGRELTRQLRAEGLAARVVWLSCATRVNIIVTPAEGRQLRFNPVWGRVIPSEWARLRAEVCRRFARVDCLVLSGSIPRGVPATAYRELVRRATRAGLKAVLDCDGRPFAEAVPAGPFLVKPNEHELAQWHVRALGSTSALLRAARALSAATGGWVLVSRGRQGGLLVNQSEGVAWSAAAPGVRVLNTVGAGDALLAAVVSKVRERAPCAEWLRWGIATGTAASECVAGGLPTRERISRLAAEVCVSPLAGEAQGRPRRRRGSLRRGDSAGESTRAPGNHRRRG